MTEAESAHLLREAMRRASAHRFRSAGIKWPQDLQEAAVQAALAAPKGAQFAAIEDVFAEYEATLAPHYKPYRGSDVVAYVITEDAFLDRVA